MLSNRAHENLQSPPNLEERKGLKEGQHAAHVRSHYYKNIDLSRLGNPCCPGFPTGNASPGQKGCPFVPGLATGTKEDLLSRVWQPGQKRTFCPGW